MSEGALVDLDELEKGRLWLYRRVLKNGKTSKVWQARFKFPDKAHERISTKQKNKASAARWARNELFKKQARYEVGLPLSPKNFSDVWEEHLRELELELASGETSQIKFDRHISTYDNYLSRFLAGILITEINEEKIKEYLAKRVSEYGTSGCAGRADKPPSPYTVNRENAVLRSVLQLGHRKGYINRIPQIPSRPDDNKRSDFSAGEWERINKLLSEEIAHLKSEKHQAGHHYLYRHMLKCLVAVCGYAGLRAGRESNQNLKWRDIKVCVNSGPNAYSRHPISKVKDKNYDTEAVHHFEIEVLYPKPKTSQRTAIGLKWLESPLRRWRAETGFGEEEDYVFCHQKDGANGEPGTPLQSMRKQFETFLKRHSLLESEHGNRTLYSCRHTFATQRIINSDIGIYDLALAMGTSVATLEKHYAHALPQQFADRLANVSNVRFIGE